jgi:hypothetical protein
VEDMIMDKKDAMNAMFLSNGAVNGVPVVVDYFD